MEDDVRIIYNKLKEVARNQGITNYSDVGNLIGLDMDTEYGRIRIAQILDDINIYENEKDRPMLSSVVILKNGDRPGLGYFKCARGLGKYQGGDDLTFFLEEVKKVYKIWSQIKE